MEKVEEELIDKEAVASFLNVSSDYIGNANSLHKLGLLSKHLEEKATEQIKNIFNTDKEVIYTSGLCESNNSVIYGLINSWKSKKKIYVFDGCSEIIDILNGYKYDYEVINDISDINITNDLELICFDDYKKIKIFKEKFSNYHGHILISITIFPTDFNFSLADLVIVSLENYNILGIGVLLKSKSIVLEPLIKGGKSTTVYRSGTPAIALITLFAKALRLLYK